MIQKRTCILVHFMETRLVLLLSNDNSWSVVGGEILIFIKDFKLISINEIKDIFALKPMDENNIQILTDLWAEDSSIWQLNIESMECIRIQSFDKYKEEYTEDIDW